MRLAVVALLCLLSASGSASAQATSAPRTFLSQPCGFQVKIRATWRIKPSRSKKCVFAVSSPNWADGDLELTVRHGTLEDSELGFTKEDGKWTLQGEESVAAESIESANWVGLQGLVATRIYENGHYAGLGDQARAVLFDRKHRIAKITCFSGNGVVPEFVKGFEFLSESPH